MKNKNILILKFIVCMGFVSELNGADFPDLLVPGSLDQVGDVDDLMGGFNEGEFRAGLKGFGFQDQEAGAPLSLPVTALPGAFVPLVVPPNPHQIVISPNPHERRERAKRKRSQGAAKRDAAIPGFSGVQSPVSMQRADLARVAGVIQQKCLRGDVHSKDGEATGGVLVSESEIDLDKDGSDNSDNDEADTAVPVKKPKIGRVFALSAQRRKTTDEFCQGLFLYAKENFFKEYRNVTEEEFKEKYKLYLCVQEAQRQRRKGNVSRSKRKYKKEQIGNYYTFGALVQSYRYACRTPQTRKAKLLYNQEQRKRQNAAKEEKNNKIAFLMYHKKDRMKRLEQFIDRAFMELKNRMPQKKSNKKRDQASFQCLFSRFNTTVENQAIKAFLADKETQRDLKDVAGFQDPSEEFRTETIKNIRKVVKSFTKSKSPAAPAEASAAADQSETGMDIAEGDDSEMDTLKDDFGAAAAASPHNSESEDDESDEEELRL